MKKWRLRGVKGLVPCHTGAKWQSRLQPDSFLHPKLFFFFLKKIILFVFGCAGSLLLHALCSSCSYRELLSSKGARASHCRAWPLGRAGLAALRRVGSSQIRDQTMSPALAGGFFTTEPQVQFSCSVVFDSLRSHGLQHTRPPCLSPTPGVYSNSGP